MTVRKLLEGDVSLIEAHLQANLQTQLNLVYADWADQSVPLRAPTNENYFRYPRAQGYQMPACFIIGETMNFLQEDGSNFVKSQDSVNVTIVMEDRVARNLVKAAYRYTCALQNLLEQQSLVSADDKLKIVVKVKRLENSPLYMSTTNEDAPENVFRKEISLYLEVEHWESL